MISHIAFNVKGKFEIILHTHTNVHQIIQLIVHYAAHQENLEMMMMMTG